jgi:hypothetical protein
LLGIVAVEGEEVNDQVSHVLYRGTDIHPPSFKVFRVWTKNRSTPTMMMQRP